MPLFQVLWRFRLDPRELLGRALYTVLNFELASRSTTKRSLSQTKGYSGNMLRTLVVQDW